MNEEVEVKQYNYNDNAPLIDLFIEVFHSEILPTLHTESALNYNYIGLANKKEYIKAVWDKSSFLLLGYNNKPIQLMVEDYEFYLYILSFFDTYGKLYRTTEYSLDLSFKESVAVSFYNENTNNIEVLTLHYNDVFKERERVHLYFLVSLKSIIFELLSRIRKRGLDIQKIMLGKNKFD